MKHASTLFLKVVVILLGIVVLAWMIIFPQLEGRAKNLDLISIYMDPFIMYGYIASIPFFVALYQAFKLLDYVEKNKIFSQAAINAARKIKYCAIAIPVFILVGQAFIILNADSDDYTGPVALGVYTSFAAIVVATAVAIFEKILQNATSLVKHKGKK